jgi:GNAT superfamily N-acetyltransferase
MTRAPGRLPSGWTVAPLTADDCDELGRVHMAVWRDTYAAVMPADYLASLRSERSAQRWRELAQRPADAGQRTLVLRDEHERIVGFASAGPSRDDDAPTAWELYAVNLAPTARGTGVADLLLDELLGGRDATLWVVEANARARAFYARRGFVDEGGRSEHEATGTPEIRMVRRAPAG